MQSFQAFCRESFSVTGLAIIAAALMLLFAFLVTRLWYLLRNRRWIRAGVHAFPTTLSLLVLSLILLVISNLTMYQRLTHEREIAILSAEALSEQRYQVMINYLPAEFNRSPQRFVIQGDEWTLEARILKWSGWANLIGLDSYYQLERIRGRYRSIEQESSQLPTAYTLANDTRGINLWRLKRMMKSALPFLDAYYGQAVYLPLVDGGRFSIVINQSGLLARPKNEIAVKAIEDW